MNKKLVKALLILGYSLPYGYLSIKGDFDTRTMWHYLFMVVCLSILLLVAIKTRNTSLVIAGNILSFISSYLFIYFGETEEWSSYIKPFTPVGLLIFITVIISFIQLVFIIDYGD